MDLGYLTAAAAAAIFGLLFGVYFQHVWPWVDAFVYSIIPFVVILVLNILIMRQVATTQLIQPLSLIHI